MESMDCRIKKKLDEEIIRGHREHGKGMIYILEVTTYEYKFSTSFM
jgi:hypothetical protein